MFDPFDDFDTAGYLRNVNALKDPADVAAAQHAFFRANLESAAQFLREQERIEYEHFLEVHRLLFNEFFPWAGTDRYALGIQKGIRKGDDVLFAMPGDCRRAVEHGLNLGNDPAHMRRRPGEVMGYFAFGHPFLDGNGRTMMIVHAELLQRAGFILNWTGTNKSDYLRALTEEIKDPNAGVLDSFLRPHLVSVDAAVPWLQQLDGMIGLVGGEDSVEATETYDENDPVSQGEYRAFVAVRDGPDNSETLDR